MGGNPKDPGNRAALDLAIGSPLPTLGAPRSNLRHQISSNPIPRKYS
ncbi:MAG: hypothetical protein A49_06060 [Methyloceanibacter sp.]|nr:MAG: hypothetical protein A49_06060 [Methyloceanibacter sp.]